MGVEFPERRLRTAGVGRQKMLQIMGFWSEADEETRVSLLSTIEGASDGALRFGFMPDAAGKPVQSPSPDPDIAPPAAPEPVVDPVPVTAPDAPVAAPTGLTDFTDALQSVSTALQYLGDHPEQAEALGVAEAAGKNRKGIANAVAALVAGRA